MWPEAFNVWQFRQNSPFAVPLFVVLLFRVQKVPVDVPLPAVP
jgi:hypothetical protein